MVKKSIILLFVNILLFSSCSEDNEYDEIVYRSWLLRKKVFFYGSSEIPLIKKYDSISNDFYFDTIKHYDYYNNCYKYTPDGLIYYRDTVYIKKDKLQYELHGKLSDRNIFKIFNTNDSLLYFYPNTDSLYNHIRLLDKDGNIQFSTFAVIDTLMINDQLEKFQKISISSNLQFKIFKNEYGIKNQGSIPFVPEYYFNNKYGIFYFRDRDWETIGGSYLFEKIIEKNGQRDTVDMKNIFDALYSREEKKVVPLTFKQ